MKGYVCVGIDGKELKMSATNSFPGHKVKIQTLATAGLARPESRAVTIVSEGDDQIMIKPTHSVTRSLTSQGGLENASSSPQRQGTQCTSKPVQAVFQLINPQSLKMSAENELRLKHLQKDAGKLIQRFQELSKEH